MCAMLILHGKMFTRMRLLLMVLYVLSASCGQKQPTGTFGRDFYIGILKTFNDQDPQFSLLITSNTSGIATIYIPYLGVNTTRSFKQSLEYKVTGDTITTVNTTVERKGIHVTTDVDVTLVVIKYPGSTWEGFLALPVTMLSTKYVIASYQSYFTGYNSNFLIVSVHDNIDIEIHVNSSKYSVSMNRLDTYLFRRYNDLSGVIVKSNKPIAVFSGHEAAKAPNTCSFGGQYLVEQLLPVEHFAHEFIVSPTPPKSGYIFRVYSSVQNTIVTHSNTTSSKAISLSKAGDFHEIISDNDPMYVMTDKPVQVMLYAACNNYKNDNIGDTFMTIVPSITQFTSSYHFTVFSSSKQFIYTHYLIITSRSEYTSGLRINGHELRNLFHTYQVSHTNLTFTVNVYNMTVGVYHLQHVHGLTFGAIQYGFFSGVAYGYVLGMDTFKDCGMLNAPRNGKVSTDNGTTYQSTAMFSCNIGFEMLGSNISVCQANCVWSNQPPNCVMRDCGSLRAPVNGQVDISNGTLVGSQAVYSCMSGYGLNGEQTRKCLVDGVWNGSQPKCQPLDEGLTCLDCKDMSHLYLCDTVTACSNGQVCYVETYKTNGGQVKYNSGCVDSHVFMNLIILIADKILIANISIQCISHKRSFNQYVSSARTSRSTPVCQNCCSSDLCTTHCNVTSQGGAGVAIVGSM